MGWELYLDGSQTEPHDEAHVLRMIAAGLPANTLVRQAGEAEWRGLKTHAPFAAALASQAGDAAPQASPAAPPQRQPPNGAPTGVIVVGAVGIFVLLAIVAYGMRNRSERETAAVLASATAATAATRRADFDAKVAALKPKITVQRFEGLDGQCAGKGKPPYGFVLQGATYEENAAVGATMGCRTFGSPSNNITNFFCCSTTDPH